MLVRSQVRLHRVAACTFANEGGTWLLTLPFVIDQDMGEPAVITVTADPGDTLNDGRDEPQVEGDSVGP
jgi:hypothetical protein